MEEDVEIDLLLKSNQTLLEEAANSIGNETNSENDEIDEPLVQTAKLTADGLEILAHDSNSASTKSLKRKPTKKQNRSKVNHKKSKISHTISANEKSKKDRPLDELQQQLDNHMISLIAKEPQKHVFSHSSIYSDESSDSEDDDKTGNSKCFINEFTAEDELPYRGTFVEEIRRQTGNKGKKQLKGGIFRELNHAQRLLLKRDELLTKLEVKLQEDIAFNKEKQNQIQEAIAILSVNDTHRNTIRQPSFTRNFFRKFGIPYFEDAKGFTSAPNEDVIKKINNNELNLLSIPKVFFWTKLHNDMLVDCIKNTLIEENTERITKEIFKLKDILRFDKYEEDVASKIEDLQDELRDVKKDSFNSLVSKENPDREYDWMKYSVMQFNNIHSADECRRFWHTYLKPTINKSKWTAEEDLKLVELVDKMHGQDWDSIAHLLGTNRSAYQCFIHYQTRIDIKHQYSTGRWTKDEDENLIKIVNISRHGDYIPWTKVAAHFPNRSHCQVYSRWNNSLNPKIVKGRFSKEEDVLVVSGIEVFGANYNELSSLMGNRSVCQIRDRYERHLLPKTSNIGTWSLEEDAELLNLVNTLGKKWVTISKRMETRSRTQVRQRYNTIQHMMKVKPGWTIEKSRRIQNSVDLGKDLKRTWRIVDKLKKQIDEIEQSFNLSNLEKETFRLEKLKELKDSIMMNKYDSKRKKRVFSENSEHNSLLIEYFKPSYHHSIVKPHLKPHNKNNSQAYLNEMLMIARHLGHEVELPKSIEEIMDNPRLNAHLKLILKDTVIKSEKTDEDIPEVNSATNLTLENIDYEPTPIDETMLMKKWWFSPPIDISRLNFAEFFKRTVFDYSSGMHADIWFSKVTRGVTNLKPVAKPVVNKQTCPSLPFLIPPNFLTTIALRTLILSKTRLKRDASDKGFLRFHKVNTPFQESYEGDSGQVDDLQAEQSNSNVEESQGQRTDNEESKNLTKMTSHFEQTLASLFSWPRTLSIVDIDATPYSKLHSYHSSVREGKVAANKVLSLIKYPKWWSEEDALELKDSHKPVHDLASTEMKNVFKRNIEVKRRALAHKRGNKCLRKMKIEHLLKKEPKKETAPRTSKIKKSKNGLCPNQRIIYKRLKKMQTKSESAKVADYENYENFSVTIPDATYEKKTKPSCSSTKECTTQKNQENEIIVVQHEGITIFKSSCVPLTNTISGAVNKMEVPGPYSIEIKENEDKFINETLLV